MSLSDDKQADIIDVFKTTSGYLDDILIINNVYFDNMVSEIYPSELQLNIANTSDTEATFLDLHLSISNKNVSADQKGKLTISKSKSSRLSQILVETISFEIMDKYKSKTARSVSEV